MANNGWYKLESDRMGRNSSGQDGKATGRGQTPGNTQRTAETSRQIQGRIQQGRRIQAPSPGIPRSAAIHGSGAAPQQRASERQAAMPRSKNESASMVQGHTGGGRHSQTVGPDGPVVMQDGVLHETLDTFVNGKTLERAVHVKGWGAFGYFQTLNSMRDYTTASIFQTPGQQTPVLTRFSLAVSTKGTPDTGRNVRGFSTKFYTQEGVFDLLCNHIPVFLVRDAIRFPDSIRAFLPSPKSNLGDAERFWGFVAKSPEATYFVTWLYSDVGTVKSLRHIRAYGVDTYTWRNAAGKCSYIKYHWIPLAGEQAIDREEAIKLAGENPDIAGQDLFDAIERGTPVEYELRVQIMDPADAPSLPYDPLDCTKTWDEQQYPLLPVGRLVLNRNPDNYEEQIEKAAFSPMNLLEGIGLSNDKMLQGRSTVYWDAQRRRLGPDFRKIPVNGQADWKPADVVSTGIGERDDGVQMRGEIAKPDDFSQAGERYHSMSPMEQEHLVDNIASDLVNASRPTQNTVLQYLSQASVEMGQRIVKQMEKYVK